MDKILNKIKKLIPKKLFKFIQPPYHYFMGWLADVWYQHPSEDLIVIGITGTTGKTTSTFLVAKTLEAAGYRVGYTSTAMFNDGEKEWLNDKKMTMLGRFFSQRMLRNMVNNGCHFAIVETTSEGVIQYRHKFINYDMLIITGLYPEHIESHGSFEKYKQAKGKLFEHLKKCKVKYADEKNFIRKAESNIKKIDFNRIKKTIIANGDDDNSIYFLNFWAEKKIAYAKEPESAELLSLDNLQLIEYGNIEVTNTGTSFEFGLPDSGNSSLIKNIISTKINLQLLGGFNAVNAMNAVCIGFALGISPDEIKTGVESLPGIPGRLERIDEGQNFTVIVDYAFEPKALTKLYETVKVIPHKKIIHVLGSAGGGRDVSRRPKLGKIAGKNADMVIITNEDPYDDDPEIIIKEVSYGAEKEGKKIDIDMFKIIDRGEAIKKALDTAKENDIVIISGKGSEQAICIANGEKITWDDRAVVRGLLASR
jgi:UDP-N-acetylmuramoyl-L-alanyl-D-glutamate--2,6-diaminopimelate ligase